MAAGTDFLEGVHRERVVIDDDAGEIGMQRAAEVRVHHELLVGHGEQAIDEAGRMQDEIGAAMHGRHHRHDAFLHGLGVRQLGIGKIAGTAQRQLQPARKLADHHGTDRRFRRAEGWGAGAE